MKNRIIFLSVFLLALLLSCGNDESRQDANDKQMDSIYIKDMLILEGVIDELAKNNKFYKLNGYKLSFKTIDSSFVHKISFDTYEELYPRFNSLSLTNVKLANDISDLLTNASIKHLKREKKIKNKIQSVYLILSFPEDVCKSNLLVNSQIGPFNFNSEQPCVK